MLRDRVRVRSLGLWALRVSCAAIACSPTAAQSPSVTLTYLGNMGVILEGGNRRVVIDGLQRGALAAYAGVPSSLLDPLEQSQEPFRTIDLALTTHRHADHFDAQSVAARLASDDGVLYVAAAETVDSLRARTRTPADSTRVRSVSFPESGESRFLLSGIDLRVLDLPHNPTPSPRVANVGFLFALSGVTVLHVGDADPTARSFTRHNLADRRVDVAIVPFWYLTGADDAVRQAIGASVWIATHVPPADTARVRRQVLARLPGATILTTPGERHTLR